MNACLQDVALYFIGCYGSNSAENRDIQDKSNPMGKRKRLVIPPPTGLEPEIARIIEALARKMAHDDYYGVTEMIPDKPVKKRRTRIRPVFKWSRDVSRED